MSRLNFEEKRRRIPRCRLLRHRKGNLLLRKLTSDLYELRDENSVLVEVFTTNALLDFLDGIITITDSNGKTWNYQKEHHVIRAKHRSLYALILNNSGFNM
jgi:hypothetical protein